MRNLLAFLAALTLTFAVLGWYLDWYTIRSSPSSAGQKSITVDINTQKIGEDIRKAEQKIQQKLAEKAKAEREGPENAKGPLDIPSPPANVGVILD